MAKLWEDIKSFVKKSATEAADRIEEEKALWTIHREIVALQKDVETKKIELGGRVYDLVQAEPEVDLKKDEKNIELVKDIEMLLEKIAAKQKEYEDVKLQAAEKNEEEQTSESTDEVDSTEPPEKETTS